jgi:hypothetical protein
MVGHLLHGSGRGPNVRSLRYLGGIGVALVHRAGQKRAEVVDFGPRAPAAADPARYRLTERMTAHLFASPKVKGDINIDGPLLVAFRSAVTGYDHTHRQFARAIWPTPKSASAAPCSSSMGGASGCLGLVLIAPRSTKPVRMNTGRGQRSRRQVERGLRLRHRNGADRRTI